MKAPVSLIILVLLLDTKGCPIPRERVEPD